MSTEYIFKYHHLAVADVAATHLSCESLTVGLVAASELAVAAPPVFSYGSASSPDRFYGRDVLDAGAAEIATTQVAATDGILLTLIKGTVAGTVTGVNVTSIAPGVAFHVAAANSLATYAGSYTVSWALTKVA